MARRIRLCVSRDECFSQVVAALVSNAERQALGTSASTTLLVTQRFHRIEPRGEVRGDQRGEGTDQKRADTDNSNVTRNHFGWDRRKLIDLARENLDVQRRRQPTTELVTVTDQRHAKAQAGHCSKEADNCSLTKEHPDDLRNVRPERFHNSDLVPLLYRYGDE